MKKDILNILILSAIMCVIIFSCTSCRTVKKQNSVTKEEKTSVASHSSDSGSVLKKVDKSVIKKTTTSKSSKKVNKRKGVKINFDTDTSNGETITTIEQKDGKLVIKTNGRKPKSIQAESQEINDVIDSLGISAYSKEYHSSADSSFDNENSNDSAHTVIQKKESNKQTNQWPILPIIIIAAIGGCLYIAYKRFYS